MIAVFVASAIAVIGVIVFALAIRARRRHRAALVPPIHLDHAIRQMRETRSFLADTEQRAKERAVRLRADHPTDGERVERLRVEVQVRARDHGP